MGDPRPPVPWSAVVGSFLGLAVPVVFSLAPPPFEDLRLVGIESALPKAAVVRIELGYQQRQPARRGSRELNQYQRVVDGDGMVKWMRDTASSRAKMRARCNWTDATRRKC